MLCVSAQERRLEQMESEKRASALRNRESWREERAKKLLRNLPHGNIGDKGRRDQMIREAEILLR